MRAGGPHIYTLRPDSNIGGEVYERELLDRLPSHGVDLVLGLPRDHAVRTTPPGWQVDMLRHRLGLHWTVAPLQLAPYVRHLLRHHRVDLLRGHSVRHTGPALLLGRALARSDTPIVLHHHHLDPRWARMDAVIAARADALITVSEHSRAELIRHGVPAHRIHVVLEGVARPPRTQPQPDAWPGDGLRLLQLGRLEARKRPWVAIDALATLSRAGIPASLVIAGEGPLESRLRDKARGLQIRFTGRVSEAEKWSLYDSAQVLLFASTLEGFGLVVAEAQSRGLPVIAAAGSATAEALDPDRSGLLAQPTAESFAARIHELLDDETRKRFAAHAADFAGRFDWDRCAADVAQVYRSIGRS